MFERRVLAIGNQKGGVGKTTTTLNLGVELVNRGRTVILVDADPQHSLTTSLGIDAVGSSLAEVLGDHRFGMKRCPRYSGRREGMATGSGWCPPTCPWR
jgi:cellulose biosynthesis protein BcsQ